MRVEPLGEEAFILRELGAIHAHELAEHLTQAGIPGLSECVASYETVGVYVDPEAFDLSSLLRAVEGQLPKARRSPKLHRVPVSYDLGLDLADACSALGTSEDRFIRLHSGCRYTCFAIGFAPGFPYLGYLPEALSGLPRLPSPRTAVPSGSVAITGRQTGIYPSDLPGGWRIVGLTPLSLVDIRDAYFPISPGDHVEFVPITVMEFERMRGERL